MRCIPTNSERDVTLQPRLLRRLTHHKDASTRNVATTATVTAALAVKLVPG